jgi:hypothetical protein
LAKTLYNDFILSPTIYKVENLKLGLGENRCGVLFIGKLNHEAVVIQGVLVD